MFVSEIKIDVSYFNVQFIILGYFFYCNDRKKGGGGIMVLILILFIKIWFMFDKNFKILEIIVF